MSSLWSETVSRIASGAMSVLLVGCSAVPIVPRVASAQESFDSQDSQLFYELLVSELAIRRGELEVAAEGYLSATKRTDDPRVAERATQLAIYYRDWPRAESVAKRWLSLNPEATAAYQSLAQIQLRQSDQAGAVEAFSGWIDASDDRDSTLRTINDQLGQERDPQFANNISTELSELYPDEALIHAGAANRALAAGLRSAALASAEEALKLDSTLVDAYLIKAQVQIIEGQSQSALVTLQNAVDAQPDSLPLHIGFAQLLVDNESYDRAGPILDRAGELSQGDSDTWLSLGLLALQSARYNQAKKFLDGVLVDDPLNERANHFLGRIADTQQDSEAAIAYFDAVPQGEFFINSRLRSAELTGELGDVDGALTRLRELRSLAVDTDIKIELISSESRILQQADQGDKAIAVLTDGLETYPSNTALLFNRALAGERNGHDEILEKDMAAILELEPDNAYALNALGYHYVVRNKRLDDAAKHLERASSLEPEDAAIMDSLGWLRFRQGKLEAAHKLLTEAYTLLPDAEIAAHLGEVLWEMGDESAAREVWDKALADEPTHEVLNAVINRFNEK